MCGRCSKFAKEEKTQELVRKVMDAIGLVVGRDQKAGNEMKAEEKKQMRDMFDLLPNASRKVIFVKTAGTVYMPLLGHQDVSQHLVVADVCQLSFSSSLQRELLTPSRKG